MKKSFLLLAGVMVGGLALADNVTDKFPWIHEGYIYLTTKDSGSSSFGGTGAIAAPLATDDAALARYGFVNLKAATPFEVAEGAHVPVTVDGAAAPAGGATVAVCTIAKAAADALTFKGVSPWKRYRVRPYVVDNGDGTVTVKADVAPTGLVIIFK